LAALDVPVFHIAIESPGREGFAVGMKCYRLDVVLVRLKDMQQTPGARFPELGGFVPAAGGQVFAVPAQGQRLNGAFLRLRAAEQFAVQSVPAAKRAIGGADEQRRSV